MPVAFALRSGGPTCTEPRPRGLRRATAKRRPPWSSSYPFLGRNPICPRSSRHVSLAVSSGAAPKTRPCRLQVERGHLHALQPAGIRFARASAMWCRFLGAIRSPCVRSLRAILAGPHCPTRSWSMLRLSARARTLHSRGGSSDATKAWKTLGHKRRRRHPPSSQEAQVWTKHCASSTATPGPMPASKELTKSRKATTQLAARDLGRRSLAKYWPKPQIEDAPKSAQAERGSTCPQPGRLTAGVHHSSRAQKSRLRHGNGSRQIRVRAAAESERPQPPLRPNRRCRLPQMCSHPGTGPQRCSLASNSRDAEAMHRIRWPCALRSHEHRCERRFAAQLVRSGRSGCAHISLRHRWSSRICRHDWRPLPEAR